MRAIALLATAVLLGICHLTMVSPATADSRVFIIPNNPDGYGVDKCLANSQSCGAHAAQSYCASRQFTRATAYRRVDPDEITGSVPNSGDTRCPGPGCREYVVITCNR